jgi:hypothetical protein
LEELRFAAPVRSIVPLIALVLIPGIGARADGPREGSPLDQLPTDTRQLTSWGERPDFRHDGKKILFLSKVFRGPRKTSRWNLASRFCTAQGARKEWSGLHD